MAAPPEPAWSRSIHIGGMMRCCIKTIRESERPTEVGSTIQCSYCGAYAEVDAEGRWRWQPGIPPAREESP
jgi:hypothetical protein